MSELKILAAVVQDAQRYRWLVRTNPGAVASIAWAVSKEACKHNLPSDAVDAAMEEENRESSL
jgi:hypothetical protein